MGGSYLHAIIYLLQITLHGDIFVIWTVYLGPVVPNDRLLGTA